MGRSQRNLLTFELVFASSTLRNQRDSVVGKRTNQPLSLKGLYDSVWCVDNTISFQSEGLNGKRRARTGSQFRLNGLLGYTDEICSDYLKLPVVAITFSLSIELDRHL